MKTKFVAVLVVCSLTAGIVVDRAYLQRGGLQADRARARYVVSVVSGVCADFFLQESADELKVRKLRARCDLLARVAGVTSIEPIPGRE